MSDRTIAAEGNGFTPPGPSDFEPPPFFTVAGLEVNKPIVVVLLASVLVALFFYAASRRIAAGNGMVPGKLQYAGESAYGFVRNSIGLETIGKEGLRFVPFLATLFFFIAVNNLFGIIPPFQLPGTSKIAIPLGLAVIVWAIYNYLGIKRAGFFGYFKAMMFPPGIPWPVYILLAPIELLSNFLVRPITLCLRLTLNMFAGHLVLVLFVLGGEYLLLEHGGIVGILAGSVAIFGSVVMTFFEAFIQLLQAYVFTLLAALYIGGALVDEH
ncbi:MAG: F-type H+-transporting ATPase subunit a [Frankiales bacterium]|nr:F-type H+-transporting ATPase subunit a [Frankiales bacterium]